MEDEKQKAELRVHYSLSEEKLSIENTGSGTACNIRIKIDGVPLKEHPGLEKFSQSPTYMAGLKTFLKMLEKMPPGSIACCKIFLLPNQLVEITWDDDSGKNRSFATMLC